MATAEPEAYASVVPHHQGEGLVRTFTNISIVSERRQSRAYDDSVDEVAEPIANDWGMAPELKAFQQQGEKDQVKGRRLGLTWTNLTVKGDYQGIETWCTIKDSCG